MKTHSGAKKRFRLTASGKVKRKKRYVRHLLVNKSSKRKRQLGKTAYVSPSFELEVKKLLGVS
ncbi:MAG: 50S ribosomal protein L35 [Bdellovibrionales bacterium]|nr:50S ribosomal protein L35 [Bdellovibrionales bacterium]